MYDLSRITNTIPNSLLINSGFHRNKDLILHINIDTFKNELLHNRGN